MADMSASSRGSGSPHTPPPPPGMMLGQRGTGATDAVADGGWGGGVVVVVISVASVTVCGVLGGDHGVCDDATDDRLTKRF